jgi:hypothetical protein
MIHSVVHHCWTSYVCNVGRSQSIGGCRCEGQCGSWQPEGVRDVQRIPQDSPFGAGGNAAELAIGAVGGGAKKMAAGQEGRDW